MSRIGQNPITIPSSVDINLTTDHIVIKGPKGELSQSIPERITVEQQKQQLVVSRRGNQPKVRALHGLMRMLIYNMIVGVTQGWSKKLEMVGTGYRAKLEGNQLVLSIGYSHPVKVKASDGIQFAVEGQNKITVSGIDKQLVGQVAADIRAVRPPEPYKGKGIRYEGEYIRRKAGKAAKA